MKIYSNPKSKIVHAQWKHYESTWLRAGAESVGPQPEVRDPHVAPPVDKPLTNSYMKPMRQL